MHCIRIDERTFTSHTETKKKATEEKESERERVYENEKPLSYAWNSFLV